MLSASNTTIPLFSTDGGDSFVVTGAHFGPRTVPAPQLPVFTPVPLPLTDATRPVTALLVVLVGSACSVTPYSIEGQGTVMVGSRVCVMFAVQVSLLWLPL